MPHIILSRAGRLCLDVRLPDEYIRWTLFGRSPISSIAGGAHRFVCRPPRAAKMKILENKRPADALGERRWRGCSAEHQSSNIKDKP
jgi:hypothetical protein